LGIRIDRALPYLVGSLLQLGSLQAQQTPNRSPPAACAAPAPITDQPVDPDSPRVMVTLKDTSVAAAAATGRRLAKRYGFRYLTEMIAMPAFVAITTPPVLERLRCDDAVREIHYDKLLPLNLLRPAHRSSARPNQRLQLPGAPVSSSAGVLIADGDQRNVEFGITELIDRS